MRGADVSVLLQIYAEGTLPGFVARWVQLYGDQCDTDRLVHVGVAR